jgi:hypothetical protein
MVKMESKKTTIFCAEWDRKWLFMIAASPRKPEALQATLSIDRRGGRKDLQTATASGTISFCSRRRPGVPGITIRLLQREAYCPNALARFINTLDSIQIPATAPIPKRLIFSQAGIPGSQAFLVSRYLFLLD